MIFTNPHITPNKQLLLITYQSVDYALGFKAQGGQLQFVIQAESDTNLSVTVGLSMDPKTGNTKVLWAGVKWAGVPTGVIVWELLKIARFLAMVFCVLIPGYHGSIQRALKLSLVLLVGGLFHTGNAYALDNFPGTTIAGTSGSLVASNVGATSEVGEPTTFGGGAVNSMWYSWTAPSNGTFTVETCSAVQTNFDTTLKTYTGAAVNALTTVAANDDACAHTTGTFASRNSLAVTSGTVYRVQVDGYGNNTGTFLLTWSFAGGAPAGDAFPGITITGLSGSATGTNIGATGETGEPTTFGGGSLNTIWYSWTAPANGSVTFDTCSVTQTDFDTTIGGYTGGAVNALTTVATNDDACSGTGGATASAITFTATVGTTYRIQVDGYASNTGNFILNWVQTPSGLSIIKTVDQSSVSAPTTLTYTISVINNAGQGHRNPVVTDILTQGGSPRTLTSGPTYVSGDTNGNGRVNNGETWIYTATYDVTQTDIDNAGTFSNVATFDSNRASTPISSSAVLTTVIANPSLSVTKTADDTTDVILGQLITYTYVITNDGNQTITSVSLADVHGGSGTAPAPDADNATLSDNGPLGDSTNPTTGDSDWDTLAPGDVLTITSTYTVTQNDLDTLQ